jgi:hypothetical protein
MAQLPRIGGSSAERIMNCLGSSQLCARLPEPEGSVFALEGTAAHTVCELALLEGIDPDDLVGRSVDAKGVRVEVTDDMAKACRLFVNHVSSFFMDASGQVDLVRRATLRIEQFVTLKGFHDRCAGTCDAWVYDADTRTLHVFDFKYGVGVPVEAEDNPQLKFYGLGALIAINSPVERVVIHVIQPRCEHPSGEYVRSWETDPEELIAFGLELAEKVEESEKAGAPRCPGDWCQFCAGAGWACKELRDVAYRAVECERDAAVLEARGDTPTAAQMGEWLSLHGPLKIWMTASRRYIWNEAQRGHIADGHKLVQTRGKRKFLEPELALRQAAREFKVDEDSLFKRKPITPRALEKIVGVKRAAEFLDAHTTKSKGLSLVPLSDKREAVTPDANSEFDDLFGEDNDE